MKSINKSIKQNQAVHRPEQGHHWYPPRVIESNLESSHFTSISSKLCSCLVHLLGHVSGSRQIFIVFRTCHAFLLPALCILSKWHYLMVWEELFFIKYLYIYNILHVSATYFNSFRWSTCICSYSFLLLFAGGKKKLQVDFYTSPFLSGECLELNTTAKSYTGMENTNCERIHPTSCPCVFKNCSLSLYDLINLFWKMYFIC